MAAIFTVKWSSQNEMADDSTSRTYPVWHLLHDARMDSCHLIEPELTMEQSAAGSFSFTIPATHPDYAEILKCGLLWDVSVYRNDVFLWAGHPITMETDLYGNCRVSCEGILGYLSDVIFSAFAYGYSMYGTSGVAISVTEMFQRMIWFYNEYTLEYSPSRPENSTQTAYSDENSPCYDSPLIYHRMFCNAYADGEAAGTEIYRRSDKNLSVMEIIHSRLIDDFGGWLEVRPSQGKTGENFLGDSFVGGMWELIYHTSPGSVIRQTLEVGKNIISLRKELDYTGFCTALVPVDEYGNAYLTMTAATGSRLEEMNGVKMYRIFNHPILANTALVKKYGLIARTHYDVDNFISPQDTSANVAAEWNMARTFEAVAKLEEPTALLEVRAVDLSVIDDAEDAITVGSRVNVILPENTDPLFLTVNAMSIRLDDLSKNTITLNGTIRTLSGML